jgi:WD40 repeat protein
MDSPRRYKQSVTRSGLVVLLPLTLVVGACSSRVNPTPIYRYQDPDAVVTAMTYSSDSALLAWGTSDAKIFLVGVGRWGTPESFPPHRGWESQRSQIEGLAFSADHRFLVSASFFLPPPAGGDIRIDRVQGGTSRLVKNAHADGVEWLAYAAGDRVLVSSSGTEIAFWDPSKLSRVGTIKVIDDNALDSISGAALSPDGRTIATVTLGGRGTIWDVATRDSVHSFRGRKVVSFASDGRSIATLDPSDGAASKRIILVAVVTERVTRRFERSQGDISQIICTQGGRWVISDSAESVEDPGRIVFWDSDSGKATAEFVAFPKAISQMAISPDGNLFAAAGFGGLVKVWRMRDLLPGDK